MKFIFILFIFLAEIVSAQEHIMVFYDKNNVDLDTQEQSILYSSHIDYIDQLKSDNYIEAYGFFENGEGVAIFPNADLWEIERLVLKDLSVASGLFKVEYFHTEIRAGEFCTTDKEQMVEYNFVRYTSHITKYNVQQVPQLLKMHDDYIKEINSTGNVAMEGVFSNSDGGFMIIKGKLAREVILNDPTYQAGFTIPEISDIFLPQGTFCEKQ